MRVNMMLVVVLVLLRPPQFPSEKAAGSWFAGRWKSRAASNRNVTRAVMALGSVALLHLAILPGLFSARPFARLDKNSHFRGPHRTNGGMLRVPFQPV